MLPIYVNAALSISSASHVVLVDSSHQAPAGRTHEMAASRERPARDAWARGNVISGTTPRSSALKDGEYVVSDRSARSAPDARAARDVPGTRQPWISALTLLLAVAVILALISACLSREALKRAVNQHKRLTREWGRHCEVTGATEPRAQTARVAAISEANAVAKPERSRRPGAMRRSVKARLSAVANLLGSLDTTPATFAQRQQLAVLPLPRTVIKHGHASASTSVIRPEPFEHCYLSALSDEGVDLPSFLDGWRRAMDDDLAQFSILRCGQIHPDRQRALLHRLSGAAGLVGALSLMEALRGASASSLEQGAGSIDALIDRTRNLIRQLETPPLANRNPQP